MMLSGDSGDDPVAAAAARVPDEVLDDVQALVVREQLADALTPDWQSDQDLAGLVGRPYGTVKAGLIALHEQERAETEYDIDRLLDLWRLSGSALAVVPGSDLDRALDAVVAAGAGIGIPLAPVVFDLVDGDNPGHMRALGTRTYAQLVGVSSESARQRFRKDWYGGRA